VATPSGDEFGGVASALSLQFTLERLIVGTRFQGVNPRLLLEKLKVLETKTKATDSDWAVWANDGAVAELFGHAFVEADDVEAGIAWYERAIAAEDGTASIHAAEQLANGRSRMGWEIVDTALRLGASASRRTTSKKGGRLSTRPRGGNRTIAQTIQRADQLIAQALGLLQRLIDIEPTMERLSLIGSAHKRSALVAAAADRQDRVDEALKEMKSAYRRAQQFGETHQSASVYYPASNCLVADVAADAGTRQWTLDPKTVAVVRSSLANRTATDPDFWSVAELVELDQYEALAAGALTSALPLLSKAYQDLHQRVQSPKMWVSVYDNACLVLSLYAKRSARSERTAAETLLATLREYAHPPTS
jgi:tetratricopeptide (TPR) repeat protein